MNELTICKATKEQITEIVEMIKRTITYNTPKGIGKTHITEYIKGNVAQDLIENAIDRIVTLRFQETLIGFAVISNYEIHLIEFFMIDGNFQHKGYGTILFNKLYEEPYEIRAIDFYSKDVAMRNFIELKQKWEPRWKYKLHGEKLDRLIYIAPLSVVPLDEKVLSLNYGNKEKDYIRDLW